MLTVTDCADYLIRRLDGEPSVSVLTLCNRAGAYLADMHTWSWLIRQPALLTLTNNQEYIVLPSDFGRMYGQPKPTTVSSVVTLEMVSMEEYLRYRQDFLDGGPHYLGSILYTTVSGVLTPRIAIWPKPTTTTADAFTLPYLAAWVDLTSDIAAIPIPSWLEFFYLEVLFAFAQSYDEHDVASLSQRLALLQQSTEFLNLKRRDGSVQPFIGKMRGGAIAAEYLYEGGVKIGIAGRFDPPS